MKAASVLEGVVDDQAAVVLVHHSHHVEVVLVHHSHHVEVVVVDHSLAAAVAFDHSSVGEVVDHRIGSPVLHNQVPRGRLVFLRKLDQGEVGHPLFTLNITKKNVVLKI